MRAYLSLLFPPSYVRSVMSLFSVLFGKEDKGEVKEMVERQRACFSSSDLYLFFGSQHVLDGYARRVCLRIIPARSTYLSHFFVFPLQSKKRSLFFFTSCFQRNLCEANNHLVGCCPLSRLCASEFGKNRRLRCGDHSEHCVYVCLLRLALFIFFFEEGGGFRRCPHVLSLRGVLPCAMSFLHLCIRTAANIKKKENRSVTP
ncbi:hypothetical protein ABB37_05188 [Leptomonas pyrrhocoris]|uniref:Uncharacterized protein n=1 Tax=Leptomonas pyrrhocoris TaxID=157538 RepID=A0A0N0DVD6_LEPPY|nr:hypothetical protein ABB37_05188 [Leptomonas pyrrhocoris]KPA80211.1 hypothetical protein ABB37_05188 [Leptomonas pyrrhocoris]|eukprot:XP_015658650.1 hypothetical protein ABB37_05188 [Leptomonas pyrrhocoris]